MFDWLTLFLECLQNTHQRIIKKKSLHEKQFEKRRQTINEMKQQFIYEKS